MKFNFKKVFKTFVKSVEKKSPEILIALGIGSMGAAAILAVDGYKKAEVKIKEKKEELGVEELDKKETIKTALPCYIKAGVAFATGTTCIIMSDKIQLGRLSAVTTTAKLGEAAFTEYRKQVQKELGKEKEQEITKKANDALVRNTSNDPDYSKDVYYTGFGDKLFLDRETHRYFRCSKTAIQNRLDAFNNRIKFEDFMSINDFWYDLNLPDIPIVDDRGWNGSNHQRNADDIRIYFEPSSEGKELCWVVSYDWEQRND